MKHLLQGKRVLVSGVCGTVGREITRLLLSNAYGELAEFVGIDNNESELFFIDQAYGGPNTQFYVRDLRDISGLKEVCSGIEIIFHTAALKHVGICENSPGDAVQTNIIGLQNILQAAKQGRAERFIFTSSDKAVNPTNVMGTSKLMGERLVTAANNSRDNQGTIFASTRFGNVLGSRGSVVPIFRDQIMNGQNITLTSKDMTRFIMTIEDAARLVISSSCEALGGEVFITKMPVARISDIADVMIEVLTSKHDLKPKSVVSEVGVKPGEKMYEELMSEEETTRALETSKYFVVLPAFREFYPIDYSYSEAVESPSLRPYISSVEPAMTPSELKDYLLQKDII